MGKIIRMLTQKKLEFKLKYGLAQRGRTGVGEMGMGGSVIDVSTKTVARHLRKDGNGNYREVGKREVLNKKVTTAFVNDIVDNLIAETSAFGDYKFHDSGTGVGAESPSDTALGTPCAEARDAGTQIEGAQTYEYKSVATHTYAGGFAITEHGLFNIAAAGILMDRTVFSAINVVASDKIEFTFTIQFSAQA